MHDIVAIYTEGERPVHHIARAVRDLGVYSQVAFTPAMLAALDAKAIILCDETERPDTTVPVLPLNSTEEIDHFSLTHFLFERAGLSASWSMETFIEEQTRRIKEQVGDKRVLLGLSGGVDSSVAALLIHRAIADQLVCVFVDHGLLRKGEAAMVEQLFREHYKINLVKVDAEARFLAELKDISDPEEKRKIIGRLFIDTFYDAGRSLGEIAFLAQGTIYADVIESQNPAKGGGLAIKSHHNVGGLPADLKWELVEPLRELFKDEVRKIGAVLGLPSELLGRHPFPGPGLGVRCVGAVTKERLDTLREVDAIFIEEVRRAGLYDEIFQAIACLLPVKSVGIRDGERRYQEVCTLRAVQSVDAIHANWYPFDPDLLRSISERILSEVPTVSRVLYDISDKPPATIEWE